MTSGTRQSAGARSPIVSPVIQAGGDGGNSGNGKAPRSQLREYFSVLVRRKWTVLAAVFGVVVTSTLLTRMEPRVYEASARVVLDESPPVFSNGWLTTGGVSAYSELYVMNSGIIKERVRAKLGPVPPVVPKILGKTEAIQLSVEGPDPERAAIVANGYAEAYVSYKREQTLDSMVSATSALQTRVDAMQGEIDALAARLATIPNCAVFRNPPAECGLREPLERERDKMIARLLHFKETLERINVTSLENGGAEIITPALIPADPIRPTPTRNLLLGIGTGLLLGIGLAFLFEHFDDSLKSKEDLERAAPDVPVLGLIPLVLGWRDETTPLLVARDDTESPAAEAYRALRTSIEHLAVERGARVIQLTSPNSGDGKTTTAANLAIALAQAGERVIVVSADLRRPRIHEFFNLRNAIGITSVLRREASLADALEPVPESEHIQLLGTGVLPTGPSELLGTPEVGELIRALRDQADFVLVDSAPVLPVTDAAVLSSNVDATIIVAAAAKTTVTGLVDAIKSLHQVDAPLVGTVLNRVDLSTVYGQPYAYGYYAAYVPETSGSVKR